MEALSMVHALREIHKLLKPSSFLIDIRPNGELVEFIRPHGEEEFFIGHMHETDDYIEYFQAEAAMQKVLAEGLFKIEKAGEFTFQVHADSFLELKNFLDENWSDSLITEEVIAEAKRLDDAHEVGKVILRERVYIKLLLPVF
jgi:hypothetical protein